MTSPTRSLPAADGPRRIYHVREAAYNVLRQWGVETGPLPILREDCR